MIAITIALALLGLGKDEESRQPSNLPAMKTYISPRLHFPLLDRKETVVVGPDRLAGPYASRYPKGLRTVEEPSEVAGHLLYAGREYTLIDPKFPAAYVPAFDDAGAVQRWRHALEMVDEVGLKETNRPSSTR